MATDLRPSFDRAHFENTFAGQGVEWFLDYKAIREGLTGLYRLSRQQRRLLYDTFKADIVFAAQLGRADYQFSYPGLPASVKEIAKPLFEALYDDILGGSTGFRMTGLRKPNLLRGHVRRGFFEANRKRDNQFNQVCPACLGMIEVDSEDGHADLDHYFTKSIYPTLSVSSDNLIPLCKVCNQTMKRAKDPLEGHRGPGQLAFLFLPYHRPGIESITIGLDQTEPDEKIVVGVRREKQADRVRVANFVSLFELNDRWSGRINSSLYETIRQDVISDFLDPNKAVTEQAVKDKLTSLFRAKMSSKSTVPDAYLLAKYVEKIIKRPELLAAFYREVTEVIDLEREAMLAIEPEEE
ncbi:hypothetical protein ACFQI7_32755 [Paenibacillus allorhizosphaerae]|uniref:HNH endonuclease n=1 Tax=Paenibacillus allorhizosphaerae TaxID=2849866 RepID=A0ABM8VUJ5_9BACL|nr:hypothetical protein [Paenibacillus allorhizosphaerae]CAG7658921.1 hypothetical protein PAECIP111802_07215 [Paenibacillus allorhizosphaerae]